MPDKTPSSSSVAVAAAAAAAANANAAQADTADKKTHQKNRGHKEENHHAKDRTYLGPTKTRSTVSDTLE